MFNVIRMMIVLLALSGAGIAHGTDLRSDGNQLLEQCQAGIQPSCENLTDTCTCYMHASWCRGFLQGVTDMLAYTNQPLFDCIPNGVTVGQAKQVVVKYLKDHPERLHESQTVLTIAALRAAFPCKQ